MTLDVVSSQALLLRGACVLSMDPTIGDFDSADILVSNGRIEAIGATLDAPHAQTIDMRNRIIIPGFVDSHRHLWEGLFRNLNADFSLGQYMGTVNVTLAPLCQPEEVYAGTLISALGALNAGVTTVLDWSQVQTTPQHSAASISALRESGLRAVFGFGARSGGIRPGDTIDADAMRRIARDHFSSTDQLLTLAVAATGPEFLPEHLAAVEWRLADELGVRIAVHVGCGAGGLEGKLGAFARHTGLNDRTTYIHCNTISDDEWRLIADTGGAVSVSLPIELGMGHGPSPIQKAVRHGLGPSLSVDVETSAPADFFTQMRMVYAVQRGAAHVAALHGEENASTPITARDVLAMATIEGARANGLEAKIGSISPGKQADLVMLRADAINVMPLNDAYSAVVTGMDTSNVDAVMIAGQYVKQNGSLVGVDLNRLRTLTESMRDGAITRAGGVVSATRGAVCCHRH